MSRQLKLASAFSILALSALALLAPTMPRADAAQQTGATIAIAAPAWLVELAD
jgi:hypothetical protein